MGAIEYTSEGGESVSVGYKRADLEDSRLNPRIGEEVEFNLVTNIRSGDSHATKVRDRPMTLEHTTASPCNN